MADYHESPETPPPLARGLRDWCESYQSPTRALDGPALESFWAMEFHPGQIMVVDEDQRRAYEIIAGYRLTRTVAILRGLMHQEGLIADIDDHPQHGDPWTRWWPPEGLPSLARDRLVRSAAEACRTVPGIPLQPPDGQDELDHWLTAMWLCSRLVGLHTHQLGRWGTERLLDTRFLADAWPAREELVRFEAVLMDATFKMVVNDGAGPAGQALERQYGMDPRESHSIVRASRERAQSQTEIDLEEERVLLLHRLEDAYRRAKLAMDLKAERNALRDMASILGLTRAEPEDLMQEMTRTLRKINQEQPPSSPTLLGPTGAPILEIPVQFQRPGAVVAALRSAAERVMEPGFDADELEDE